ncbi:MAG: lysophospholipid acyltransferase family protein [Steroidobacteraceae bacterium]
MGSHGFDTLPTIGAILRAPLPHLAGDRVTRWLLRGVAASLRPLVVELRGATHIAGAHDPFILVANHSNRLEAMILPTLLFLLRGGRLIHFIADWNFLLVPGIGNLMRRGEVLTSMRKNARPRFLNRLRHRHAPTQAPFARAAELLAAGRSIGVFPEGTANRDPHRLLRGRHGAARLSLHSGAPIVPVGIRFPFEPPGAPIRDFARLAIEIGTPLAAQRPSHAGAIALHDVRAHHAAIMTTLAALSGKTWHYT